MPCVDDVLLYEVFQKYCNFGNRNGPATATSASNSPKTASPSTSITASLMDGTKFAKLAREAGLLDEIITMIDVDILFSKVKDRSERKISFLQFRMALKLLAEKKYSVGTAKETIDAELAEENVLTAVRNLKGPQLSHATVPESSDTIDRLMDGPANYISKSPSTDERVWKDNLRRNSSPISSRRISGHNSTLVNSRKSSLNPNVMSAANLPESEPRASTLQTDHLA